MRRTYDVHGIRMEVVSENPRLADVFEPYLAPFEAGPGGTPAYTVEILPDALPVRPEGLIVYDGQILPGVPAQVMRSAHERWYWVPGQVAIRLGQGEATVMVDDACDLGILSYALIHVLDAAFAENGQYMVHGAALVMPGDVPRALLLLAPSGRGKTTAALALSLSGFALMTDDAIIVSSSSGTENASPCCAWGLPRALKVHQVTAQLLPAVAPLLGNAWDANGEQVLKTETFATLATVVTATRIDVGAIAVLGDRISRLHYVARLAKPRAMQLLAEDNVFRTSVGVPEEQLARFTALSSLVRQVPTYEIRVGHDLSTLGNAVISGLNSA